jgi:hypothetical protein
MGFSNDKRVMYVIASTSFKLRTLGSREDVSVFTVLLAGCLLVQQGNFFLSKRCISLEYS